MKPRTKSVGRVLNESLGLFDKLSLEEIDSARAQALKYLESPAGEGIQGDVADAHPVRPARRSPWLAVATIAAAIAIAVLLPARVLRSAPAVLEEEGGSRKIQYGEVVRPNAAGGTLRFPDGSSVEMRAQSEVSFERAEDGVRLRVRTGDVIVTAAAQPSGQLVVETKDVSAVGKVFLVNAKEDGSRVAVLSGEARVQQQGATEKKLGPGDQVATSALVELQSVAEEIRWSRSAESLLAMMREARTPALQQKPAERLAFEVASIRPSVATVAAPGARGSGGGTGPDGCGNGLIQLDAGRLFINGVSLQNLITMAYPDWARPRGGCGGVVAAKFLTAGLEWTKSDSWDVEAVIPKGIPSYTMPKYVAGETPEIYAMLQNLLAERFKLVLRRETKEIPVQFLTVAKGGPKFNGFRPGRGRNLTTDENGNVIEVTRDQIKGRISMLRSVGLTAINVTMADWARSLNGANGRPVIDRTGLTGEYSFYFDNPREVDSRLPRQSLSDRQEEIGLKLEDGKALVEVWAIERAEKPSEN